MTSFYIIIGIVLWVALAFWPASVAKRKGYSFILFLLLSLFVSWLITLIVVLFLKDKNQTPESIAADKAAEAALEREENAR